MHKVSISISDPFFIHEKKHHNDEWMDIQCVGKNIIDTQRER